jgi:alpha-N-arabinofuranosidase
MAVVNVHENNNFETRLEEVGSIDIEVFRAIGQNVRVVNTEGREEVRIKESRWNGEGLFSFLKHLLALLRWKI